jgi:hypothetical protein
MSTVAAEKDPNSVEPYFFVWCDLDAGTNVSGDDGELQGATISTKTITAAAGITVDSSSLAAVTVNGVSYAINTVVTVWLSGGTDGVDYNVTCRIVTSDSRTLEKTMVVPVKSQ